MLWNRYSDCEFLLSDRLTICKTGGKNSSLEIKTSNRMPDRKSLKQVEEILKANSARWGKKQ